MMSAAPFWWRANSQPANTKSGQLHASFTFSFLSRNLIEDTYLFWSFAFTSFSCMLYSFGVYVFATTVARPALSRPVLYATTRTNLAFNLRNGRDALTILF